MKTHQPGMSLTAQLPQLAKDTRFKLVQGKTGSFTIYLTRVGSGNHLMMILGGTFADLPAAEIKDFETGGNEVVAVWAGQ